MVIESRLTGPNQRLASITVRITPTQDQASPGLWATTPAEDAITDEHCYVWEVLAPRFLHPSKLALIQVLLEQRKPLALDELAKTAEISKDHARYHCRSMQKAAVLEIVGGAGGNGNEPSYLFSQGARPR